MFTAALTWPEAVLASVSVLTLGLVLSVVAWQIFRTGQTAIRKEGTRRDDVESLRKDVDELRAEVRGPDLAR